MYVKKSIAVHGFHFMTNHRHANQMKEVRILLSQKSCPDLYSNLLYKMDQDFLDRQYDPKISI